MRMSRVGGKEVSERAMRRVTGDGSRRRGGEESPLISPGREFQEMPDLTTGKSQRDGGGSDMCLSPTYEELKHLGKLSSSPEGASFSGTPARENSNANKSGKLKSKAKSKSSATNSPSSGIDADKPSSSYEKSQFEGNAHGASNIASKDQNSYIGNANSTGNKDKTSVVTKDPTAKPKEKPKREIKAIPQTNLAIGCLVAVCFNPPFGILAMYCSLRAASAYRDGDNKRGASRARTSIFISLFGIALTMIIVSSLVVYFAANKHSGRKYRARGSALGL